MIRTKTAFVNALVIVLTAVTGWAAYETRRGSAAEREVVQLRAAGRKATDFEEEVERLRALMHLNNFVLKSAADNLRFGVNYPYLPANVLGTDSRVHIYLNGLKGDALLAIAAAIDTVAKTYEKEIVKRDATPKKFLRKWPDENTFF